MCVLEIKTFWLDVRCPQQAIVLYVNNFSQLKYLDLVLDHNYFLFLALTQTLNRHSFLNTNPKP